MLKCLAWYLLATALEHTPKEKLISFREDRFKKDNDSDLKTSN